MPGFLQKLKACFNPTYMSLKKTLDLEAAKKENIDWLAREERISLQNVKEQLRRAEVQLNKILTQRQQEDQQAREKPLLTQRQEDIPHG